MNPYAIILSGGESKRMGQNKALLPFWGKPLVVHVLRTMSRLSNRVLVSANTHELDFLHRPIVPDRFSGYGPLAGLHACLEAASAPWAFVATCDLPMVPPELFLYLFEKAETEVQAIVPVHQGRVHPLCGVYRTNLSPVIEQRLWQGQRSVMGLLDTLETRYVEINEALPFYSEHLFLNLNTPDDYQTLLKMETGIKVLFFGITGDIAGKPVGFYTQTGTVGQLKTQLFEQFPALAEQPFRIAVNRVFAGEEHQLCQGDEIALLPPFAGG